ncbi:HAD-IA family hydrolase [Pseudomonas sp. DCB_CB]|uniref:bifunctional mannitol-1-phosphate dehydrogenase/phosphatase n=1 Tax=Pseudomonas TaxID=286 RepID=UPI00156E38BE|nr:MULTISPECIES: HAD family hydrolase [Pseudomonas]EKT4567531.1 HAD-IA family hydrolase [Pseudomonas putida]MCE0992188.1 HAD-IA family hydrolase [Pseudomonas alloputida]MCE1055291.1 HAD-IA family hydrolase [Pseudomonas alloputida]MCX2693834.1 HAD-IA family hydrolase [Pseudomonas sp. DCB_BZ]MCX2859032.1 HAD-IA family hydrolase [Pseudomonas sp. DCB_CB]
MLFFHGKHIFSAIFDMDGTLFDTERLRFKTLKQASLEIFGKALSEQTLIGSLGLSAKKAEALAKAHNGDDFPYAQIRQRADELELAYVRNHGVPIKAGLLEVLERLRKSGLTMAVATSSRRAIAEEYLINANVLKYFDITVCGDEVSQGKPHPEIFLKAARALNCEPGQCFMVEDSENGMLSAMRAEGQAILIEDIKPPAPEIKAGALKAYRSMHEFLADLSACVPDLGMPALSEPFPASMNQFSVGIHGFGAIGGGYLTQVFSHWDGYTRPREIIAATRSRMLRESVSAFGRYSVRYGATSFDQTIDNVRMIDMDDDDAVISMYTTAEIIGLSLPEQAIRSQARVIAQGLLQRFERRGRELTLLIVLNKVGGAAFVRRHVQAELALLCPPAISEQVLQKTHFAETVVSRIVSKLGNDALVRQLRIKSQMFQNSLEDEPASTCKPSAPQPEYERLIGHFRPFAQPSSAMSQLHLVLFNSEADMPLYAERGSDLLERLRQVKTVPDIAQIQIIKNRLWNGPHAIVAWYASLLGHAWVGQGMGDARVSELAERLIRQEVAPALVAEYPQMAEVVSRFAEAFLERCKTSFKDPCARVGRDPLRKLQRNERILSSIDLARKHGIATPALAFGAALAIHHALQCEDDKDQEARAIRQVYRDNHTSVEAVLTHDSDCNGKRFPGLDPITDAQLITAISDAFRQYPQRDMATRRDDLCIGA